MKDTDWKPAFDQEFDTSLFELKALRPAFVPLEVLLLTRTFFIKYKSTKARAAPQRTTAPTRTVRWMYSGLLYK